jgi:prevent-host-death family protein
MSTVTVSVSEARASLPQLLDRVLEGEEVTITRHGQPVAVVVRPDALRVRRAEAALAAGSEIGALLEEARRAPLASATLSLERAEELISEVRAGRSRR